jgi:class 3 adenylate cyclase
MGLVDTQPWEQAGLYRPGSPGADERRALLDYLTEQGATLAQLIEASRVGALPAVAGDLVLGAEPPTVSVQELASRCDLPVERVERVFLAAGLPVAADGMVPADLDVLIQAFKRAAGLMGEDAILAFTRVLGAAATNIAEAAVALFYAELGPGTGREGHSELDRARQSEAATEAFAGVPEILARVLLAQFWRISRPGARGRTWLAPEAQPDAGPAPAEPSEITALGFVDLIGSTSWAEELGLREQSLALSRFESAAWSSAVLAGGRVVKMIGDEVFFAAPSVEAACCIGLEVCHTAAVDPVLPPARGAVGYGTVVAREGDYFGPLVNVVSRLVKVAGPGELVVTEAAAELLPADRWSVRALAPQHLRGLERPVAAFIVDRKGQIP